MQTFGFLILALILWIPRGLCYILGAGAWLLADAFMMGWNAVDEFNSSQQDTPFGRRLL